jgi:hypothetical protein
VSNDNRNFFFILPDVTGLNTTYKPTASLAGRNIHHGFHVGAVRMQADTATSAANSYTGRYLYT